MWHLRAEADRRYKAHWFRGKTYDFNSLLELRKPGFADENTDAEKVKRYDACQRAIAELARRFRSAKADVAIIFGNDQEEVFLEEFNGAFTIFNGREIPNMPMTEEQKADLPIGIAIAEEGHAPPEAAVYRGASDVAETIIGTMLDLDFDVAVSSRVPNLKGAPTGVPHAFGYIYRRLMEDAPPPSVPIFINVGVPPNRPHLSRIMKFSHALKCALEKLPADMRVVVVASGGLTHLTIDEELDRSVIDALQKGDEQAMMAIPEAYLEGNSAEIKSWFGVAAVMNDYGKRFELLDYVPCYRSVAGTGHAMAFAHWQ
jgi:hypothetical protein